MLRHVVWAEAPRLAPRDPSLVASADESGLETRSGWQLDPRPFAGRLGGRDQASRPAEGDSGAGAGPDKLVGRRCGRRPTRSYNPF